MIINIQERVFNLEISNFDEAVRAQLIDTFEGKVLDLRDLLELYIKEIVRSSDSKNDVQDELDLALKKMIDKLDDALLL